MRTILLFVIAFIFVGLLVQASPHTIVSASSQDTQKPKPKEEADKTSSGSKSSGSGNIKQEGNGNNAISGANGTIINNYYSTQPPAPEFHERDVSVSFSIGEGGITFKRNVGGGRPIPLLIGDYVPVTFSLEGDKMLFDFSVWDQDSKSPIVVHNNDFVVRPDDWDRNSNANALEVINPAGRPVFQMIRKRPNWIVVNGIFPTPAGVMLAGPDGMQMGARTDQINNFHLKPIFKYPSWKYPGQLAE